MTDKEKLESILQHIERVEYNCRLLASRLIDKDFISAINLIQRGRLHDASKLGEFELLNLWSDEKDFKLALVHHHRYNSHHPEYYPNGIYGMSDLDIAEMVCDCTARSQESGLAIRDWLFGVAPKKYGFEGDQEIYEKLEYYLNILLNKPL